MRPQLEIPQLRAAKAISGIIFLALVVLSVARSPRAQPLEHFLDLIGIPSIEGTLVPTETGNVPPAERALPGAVVVTSHATEPSSPFTLRMTLLGFDMAGYAGRDPFVYEVRLVNAGRQNVRFPWFVDSSLFRATDPESYVILLGLGDRDKPADHGEIGRIWLYGSTNVPGSLERIQPGETVRIRVRSDWMVFTTGVKQMSVFLHPSYRGIRYPTILSDNTLPVRTLGRRMRDD
jgi:hypothetical protein